MYTERAHRNSVKLTRFLITAMLLAVPVAAEQGTYRQTDREVLQTAQAFLKQGDLKRTREICHLVQGMGDEALTREVTNLMHEIDEIERSSVATLTDGQIVAGRFRLKLRGDQLGLRTREMIPMGEIRRIDVDYVVSHSKSSQTSYIETLLNIQFRDAAPVNTNLTEEISILVEENDGGFRKIILGYPYELLSRSDLDEEYPQVIRDRVSRIVVYGGLE